MVIKNELRSFKDNSSFYLISKHEHINIKIIIKIIIK